MSEPENYLSQPQWSLHRVGPVLLAVSIGAGAGLAAVGFYRLVYGMEWLFFKVLGGWLHSGVGPLFVILVVAFGGLLVGLTTHFIAPETKGHGIPEVKVAVSYLGGRIRARVALFKALTAAVCIGSGGSAGREGPIVQIGAAIGSGIAQLLRLPDHRVAMSVACGAAAGIAATFNAPLAGVIFALEVILSRFTALTFGLVVLSSATATIVSRAFLGDYVAFQIHADHLFVNWWEIILYALLGVVCALVGQIFIRTLYGFETLAERITMPPWLKPAIGGALVGMIGIWMPQVLGGGYGTIEKVLDNDPLRLSALGLLALTTGKIICTSFTIGSGGAGGVFGPSLFVGAMLGGAFGDGVNFLFPGMTGSPGAYGVVGMASLFAGAAHAPITAVLIVFEMTDNYRIIVPLMTATVLSTQVSQWISIDSIDTIAIRRQGLSTLQEQDVNLMDAIPVRDAMLTEFPSVSPDLPLSGLLMRFANEHENGYPIIDDDNKLIGMVTMKDVEDALIRENPDMLTVAGFCTNTVVVCRPDQSLSSALALFGAHDLGRLPVIDPYQPDCVIGMLTRSAIVTAYANAYHRSNEAIRRLDHIQAANEQAQIVFHDQSIRVGTPLAGKPVHGAQFPPGMTLVAIRRGEETMIPRVHTKLLPGDVITVASTRREVKPVIAWLKAHC